MGLVYRVGTYAGRSCRRVVVLAALALLACRPAPASPAQGPGRIAVTGTYPTGYVGLLARYGLPHDILLEYQLSDPDVVGRYDLVIASALAPAYVEQAWPGFQRVLAKGGAIILDASLRRSDFLAARVRQKADAAASKYVVASFRLVGADNPLRADVGKEDAFPASRGAVMFAGVNPATTTVLAEYTDVSYPAARRLIQRGLLPADPPDAAHTPAILLERSGKGRILHCGPALGYGIGQAGLDYDRLVLGLLRLATNGRAVPQLDPEGVRLGRRESARSLRNPNGGVLPAGRRWRRLRGARPTATTTAPTDAPQPAEESLPTIPPAPDWPAGTGASAALPAGFQSLEEEAAPEFDVSGTLQKGGDVLLNWWNAGSHVKVSLSPAGLAITEVAGGRSRTLASRAVSIAPGTPFVIKERRDHLRVMAGRAVATVPAEGFCRGGVGVRGELADAHYQPVEPVYFSDDFMRSSDEKGGWETTGGTWETAPVQNPDMGANPFSYKVHASGDAFALAGVNYWDEYRLTASVQPDSASGSVGLGVYARDARNMLLFRARMTNGKSPDPRGFELVRLADGVPQVLASCAGGLVKKQWYRIRVKVEGPWIGAFVDGVKVLTAQDTRLPGGRIALSAAGGNARFDDVLVEPAAAPLPAGQEVVARVPEYAGVIDVDSWAGPAVPWDADANTPGLFWRRGCFHGDLSFRFQVPALPDGGRAVLLVDGDGVSPQSGIALVLQRDGAAGRVALLSGAKVLSRASLDVSKPADLCLRREGARILGLADGKQVVACSAPASDGPARVAFRAAGFRPRISQVSLWCANLRDYTFDTAPVDWWVGSGEWDVTNRWSCTPDWSWFGGCSDQVASIWQKRLVKGDVVLDFYGGPKMLQDANGPKERMGDLNATLCGDGRDVYSGYAFVVGEGKRGEGAKLLRKGKVVAENEQFAFFTRVHNRWANVRVEKQGATLRLVVEGQPVLEYKDPEPLPDGYAGVWTQDNGIMLPRITLCFQGLGPANLALGSVQSRTTVAGGSGGHPSL